MTVEQLIFITNAAADDSRAVESRLPREVLDWHGYGAAALSVFLNALCARIPNCRYIEFGSFAGRSLLAAAYGNAGRFTGVDNHSWLGQGAKKFESQKALLAKLEAAVQLAQHSAGGPRIVEVRTINTQNLALTQWLADQHACDVFMYDGDHAAGPTRDGILTMARTLKPGVLLMDDYASSKWREVPGGTRDGLEQSGLVIHHHFVLPYHTGLGVWIVDQP